MVYDRLTLFTVRLYAMQRTVLARPFCPSVCPSIRLSVCRTRELWQNQRNLCPHSYTTWNHIPFFLTRRMVGGGQPLLYLRFGVKLTLLERERRLSVFNRY